MHGRSLRLQIDTQEALSDEVVAKITSNFEKLGWFTFSVSQIKPEDILNLPEIKHEESDKSPGQRLRNTLYVLWEHEGKPGTFESFYLSRMEKIIDWVKEKLT